MITQYSLVVVRLQSRDTGSRHGVICIFIAASIQTAAGQSDVRRQELILLDGRVDRNDGHYCSQPSHGEGVEHDVHYDVIVR